MAGIASVLHSAVPSVVYLASGLDIFCHSRFCGDCAGDLGRALGKEVVHLEDGSLLYNHTAGKTICGAGGHLLVVPKVEEEPSLCPVAAFDRYVAACKSGGFDLRKGYLFPPTSSPLYFYIKDGPLSLNAATKRLGLHLPSEDLTAHGVRAGSLDA